MNDDEMTMFLWVSVDGELAQLEMHRGLGSYLSPGVGHSRVKLYGGKR